MWHTSRSVASNTPCVDGYVTIRAPSVSRCAAALARRAVRSMLPRSSVCTTTTLMPALTAPAGVGRGGRAPAPATRGEPALELAEQLGVTLRLLPRCERVHATERRPRDGNHLRGRIELHRAAAQRNHGGRQRQVA